jgi:type IV secretion system protein VirB4
VADATSKPELLSTILSACHTKIFLPDAEALSPTMAEAYARIGLTTAEIQILARAQAKRDYYYRSVKGRRLFKLDLGPATLAFVGLSSEADQRFLDRMLAEREPDEFAGAMLAYRGVDWAVAELAPPVERAEGGGR